MSTSSGPSDPELARSLQERYRLQFAMQRRQQQQERRRQHQVDEGSPPIAVVNRTAIESRSSDPSELTPASFNTNPSNDSTTNESADEVLAVLYDHYESLRRQQTQSTVQSNDNLNNQYHGRNSGSYNFRFDIEEKEDDDDYDDDYDVLEPSESSRSSILNTPALGLTLTTPTTTTTRLLEEPRSPSPPPTLPLRRDTEHPTIDLVVSAATAALTNTATKPTANTKDESMTVDSGPGAVAVAVPEPETPRTTASTPNHSHSSYYYSDSEKDEYNDNDDKNKKNLLPPIIPVAAVLVESPDEQEERLSNRLSEELQIRFTEQLEARIQEQQAQLLLQIQQRQQQEVEDAEEKKDKEEHELEPLNPTSPLAVTFHEADDYESRSPTPRTVKEQLIAAYNHRSNMARVAPSHLHDDDNDDDDDDDYSDEMDLEQPSSFSPSRSSSWSNPRQQHEAVGRSFHTNNKNNKHDDNFLVCGVRRRTWGVWLIYLSFLLAGAGVGASYYLRSIGKVSDLPS